MYGWRERESKWEGEKQDDMVKCIWIYGYIYERNAEGRFLLTVSTEVISRAHNYFPRSAKTRVCYYTLYSGTPHTQKRTHTSTHARTHAHETDHQSLTIHYSHLLHLYKCHLNSTQQCGNSMSLGLSLSLSPFLKWIQMTVNKLMLFSIAMSGPASVVWLLHSTTSIKFIIEALVCTLGFSFNLSSLSAKLLWWLTAMLVGVINSWYSTVTF